MWFLNYLFIYLARASHGLATSNIYLIISLLLFYAIQHKKKKIIHEWLRKVSRKVILDPSLNSKAPTLKKKSIWNGVCHKIKNKASNYRSQQSTSNCNATKYRICIALHYSPHGTLFQMLVTLFIEMINEPLI